MDYAAAVNAEAHDLQAGRRRRHPARRAVAAQRSRGGQALSRSRRINRALEGIKVPTVVHLCFGYAARGAGRASRPATRSCRSSPTASPQQISIEAAQPKLDLGVLKDLARQEDHARRDRLLTRRSRRRRWSPTASAPA